MPFLVKNMFLSCFDPFTPFSLLIQIDNFLIKISSDSTPQLVRYLVCVFVNQKMSIVFLVKMQIFYTTGT